MEVKDRILLLLTVLFAICLNSIVVANDSIAVPDTNNKLSQKIVYIVSDIRIPFWSIMGAGIQNSAQFLGYKFDIYSANNSAKRELELTVQAIREDVAGLIISPTSSSASVTILKLAEKANIPVVISDIGTDSGEYVSYISSDNKSGAYDIGKILTTKMVQQGWGKGSVGIIAIPQKRANGRDRTAGFMKALNEVNIKSAGIKQQVTFSYQETYDFSKEFIEQNSKLRAIWLQGSDRYQAALNAINDAGKKNEVFLVCFDVEPAFLKLIPDGVLIGTAMQQPYLMGQEAMKSMHSSLDNKKVIKNLQLPILAISAENIAEKLTLIRKNVLGLGLEQNDANEKN